MKGKPIRTPIQPVRLNPPVKMPPSSRLEFMRENGIAVFVEADRTTGAVHIEKLGTLANWDIFVQLVLHSDADTLCDSTGSKFPFRLCGQGETLCLFSWFGEDRAAVLFFDSEREGQALTDWIRELDQKVRLLYQTAGSMT